MTSVSEPNNVIYGLYCVCHPEDGIRYVGQTRQGSGERLRGHLYRARVGGEYPVNRWIRKHGGDNIRSRVMEQVASADQLDEAELRWIAKLGTYTPGASSGLNCTPGGVVFPESSWNGETLVGRKDEETLQRTRRQEEVLRLRWEGVPAPCVANRLGLTEPLVYKDSRETLAGVVSPIGPRRPPIRCSCATQHRGNNTGLRLPGNTKLNAAKVLEIRDRYEGGESKSYLANAFGVHYRTITFIVNRVTWKNVP